MGMRVLVIGSGGREDAIVWKLAQAESVDTIFCAPGNPGITRRAECVGISPDDFPALAVFARGRSIDLTIVGPEAPLAAGIADYFRDKGLAVFGPSQAAARLESSKAFAKRFMKHHGVATARSESFTDFRDALSAAEAWPGGRMVVKADGLAAGKGVSVCETPAQARAALEDMMVRRSFGSAADEVVIEEYLEGEEVSLMLFVAGSSWKAMVSAQDHKRLKDGDQGPNTGGMGAYAPAPVLDHAMMEKVRAQVIEPVMAGLAAEKLEYRGVLYIGLMIQRGEPMVLEFNCRFGDPETQVVLPLLKSDLGEICRAVAGGSVDKTTVEWYNQAAVCVVLAAPGYPGPVVRGQVIEGLDAAGCLPGVMVFHAGTVQKGAHTLTAGGRVLGITATGPNVTAAAAAAYKGAALVSFPGMQMRADIARRAIDRENA